MSKFHLLSSVGVGGDNQYEDVMSTQKALNAIQEKIGLDEPLLEDGQIHSNQEQSKTCQAICLTQQTILGFKKPDGLISKDGKSHKAIAKAILESTPTFSLFLPKITPKKGLTEIDYANAADLLKCDVAAIKAVSQVESSGSGYFENDAPCILFEAHQFSKYSHHHFDESHPEISAPKWDRSLYVGGEKEYERLQKAMMLDRNAALKSASFGRYQIMGFNYKAAGYGNIEDFVRDMFFAEHHHLIAFTHFIKSNHQLLTAIQQLDWPTFARYYNGPSYAENKYDEKLKNAYNKHNLA